MDEKEESNITISSFITHPSYFLISLRASVSPCFFMNYDYSSTNGKSRVTNAFCRFIYA